MILPALLIIIIEIAVVTSEEALVSQNHHNPIRVVLGHGEWASRAALNLSRWRSNLFKNIEQFIEEHDDSDVPLGGWERYKPFAPYITCPPGRPLRRVGPSGDGGKWLCEPSALQEPCLVVSAGSNMDFRFEEAMLNETKCGVLTLDCTVEGRVLSTRHSFLKVCVGSEAQSRADKVLFTYRQILKSAGLPSIPLLKIDVESAEYPFFADWNETTPGLPEQISVELHLRRGKPHAGAEASRVFPRRKQFGALDLALFFCHMANLGYGIVAKEVNVFSINCSEYTFFRVERPALHHDHSTP